MIWIRGAELIRADLPLVRPFRTSFGTQDVREAVLLRVDCDVDGTDATGWGECVAMSLPLYSEEWAEGAWTLLRDVLIPMLAASPVEQLSEVPARMSAVRGNRMAKAAAEMALTDAALRAHGVSLASHLGAVRDRVECGVSIGIAPSTSALIEQVAEYLHDGYRRIKCKIEPGNDVAIVAAVREAFPDVSLTVDANAAYTLADAAALEALDQFELGYIEQPLAEDDVHDHAVLASRLATPICLDESITSSQRAKVAIAARACGVINIKQGRLGGLTESRRVHDLCAATGIPVWCGGMLETGIGRAANLALAAMPGFTMPGDTSASRRYFHEDVTEPFEMSPDGTIAVPHGPGLGVEPIPDVIRRLAVRREKVAV